MKTLWKAIVAAGILVAPLYANAIPVTFDLSGSKSSVEVTSFTPGNLCVLCGVSVDLYPALGAQHATLNPGESWNFNFFTIGFSGLFGGGTGTISASLGFDAPAGAQNAGGEGSGGFLTFLGVVTGGHLTWQGGGLSSYTLTDGTAYSVEFNDLDGVGVGTAMVTGTIRLQNGPGSVAVPEPTTLALFGIGLLALGLMRYRKGRS